MLQTMIRTIYPPQCVGCEALTEDDHGLCATCWTDTVFIHGAHCDACGAPLPGESQIDGLICDDCISTKRPWTKGRAALGYIGKGRSLVLSLKHGDRTDLAKPAARWMARYCADLLTNTSVFVPIPLHWTRMVRRTYNQAALLSAQLSHLTGTPHVPDALRRPHATPMMDGLTQHQRFELLHAALRPNPRKAAEISGRDVVLVDDVMTSGATFSAATKAVKKMGARRVCVLALARVTKAS